jgi:hypothetical protein
MSEMKNRIRKLELKLKKRGLELRKDSALCSLYINKKTDLNIDYIVQRMCEMNYLYEYCDMKNIKTQVYNYYASNEYIKDYEGTISTQAEKIALEKYSQGIYPKVFPWKLNNDELNNDELNIANNNNKIDGEEINIYKIFGGIIIGYLFGVGLVFSLFKSY